jgi:hypothetical protein
MADQKYLAASIPRSIRAARLRQVRLESIIGSWHRESSPGQFLVYDVVMLPEQEFIRMRAALASTTQGTPSLQQSSVVPPYIPTDTKEFIVPAGEADAFAFAKQHFVQEFKLNNN